jgi:hypothetical protein
VAGRCSRPNTDGERTARIRREGRRIT